jgi:hypothetical protein
MSLVETFMYLVETFRSVLFGRRGPAVEYRSGAWAAGSGFRRQRLNLLTEDADLVGGGWSLQRIYRDRQRGAG